jgi:transcriptional regulator MraZ
VDQVLEHFFSGSTLVAVDAKGRLSVPAPIRQKIERRSDMRAIMLTRHPDAPCLAGFDTNYLAFLHAENERRRGEEGNDPRAHESRARLSFGNAEEVSYDASGRILLSAKLRNRGQIEELALFVGVGPIFELWNPRLALDYQDPAIRAIAQEALDERGIAS